MPRMHCQLTGYQTHSWTKLRVCAADVRDSAKTNDNQTARSLAIALVKLLDCYKLNQQNPRLAPSLWQSVMLLCQQLSEYVPLPG